MNKFRKALALLLTLVMFFSMTTVMSAAASENNGASGETISNSQGADENVAETADAEATEPETDTMDAADHAETETGETAEAAETDADAEAEEDAAAAEKPVDETASEEITTDGSLLPLEERYAYIVVSDDKETYGDMATVPTSMISAVPLETILECLYDSDGNHIEIDPEAKMVWSYYKDAENNTIFDDYFVIDEGGTLDLSVFSEYDRYTLEMIVGDGNQLNPDNIRYIVTVYLNENLRGFRTYELYTQDEDGTRHPVKILDQQATTLSANGQIWYTRNFIVEDYDSEKDYYLGVNDSADEHPNVVCNVYTYINVIYYAYGIQELIPLQDNLVNVDMRAENAGYKLSNYNASEVSGSSVYNAMNNMLVFAYSDVNGYAFEGKNIEYMQFQVTGVEDKAAFSIDEDVYSVDEGHESVKLNSTWYAYNDGEWYDSDNGGIEYDKDDNGLTNLILGTTTYTNVVWLKEGYSSYDEYYYALTLKRDDGYTLIKAVNGLYDSYDAAANAKDIKDQLVPEDGTGECGYKAVYKVPTDSGDATSVFTLFFEDESGSIITFRLNVLLRDYDQSVDLDYYREYSDVPVVGEQDPWFRITGASDAAGDPIDTYILENGKSNNMDTMYGYGYQTVFVNEDVSTLVPTYWVANDSKIKVEKVYVNGLPFNAGDSISFPEGENTLNAIFSVTIEDDNGLHPKMYNVTFIKKTSGPQLYVAGPTDPEVRSVFLDEYFEYKHDIFVANVGDEPITDLRLELDATNVALDSYWTIGGEGNDTLAACPDNFELESAETKYGELSNVAKIRLVPDGEGEIEGTLKIYSGDQLLETINLSGQAQNPKILTEELPDGVKYVPYSYMVYTSNMYDWLDVEYTLTGDLPDGVEWYPETGEIYGVPTETGTFNITIEAAFTSDTYSFESSSVDLTLNILDNTDYNVYTASDSGYSLEDTIGTDVGGYRFELTPDTAGNYSDELFWSEGEFGNFRHYVFLNGEMLTEGVDYEAESGSTKITVYAQTFANKAVQGQANTIAAEFRQDGDAEEEMYRSAQNFYLVPVENTNSNDDPDPAPSNNNNETPSPSPSSNNSGNAAASAAGNGRASAGNGTTSGAQNSNAVTCIVYVQDASGAAVGNLSLELHSTPQTAITDGSGTATFSNVEFGDHTLYVKDGSGAETASKSFKLVSGNSASADGDTITAAPGSSVKLTLQYDGNELELLSAETESSPKTGDDTPIAVYFVVTIVLTAAMIPVCTALKRRKKEY